MNRLLAVFSCPQIPHEGRASIVFFIVGTRNGTRNEREYVEKVQALSEAQASPQNDPAEAGTGNETP